ncbi:MAG: hypothetical protein J3Q66DRAFT_326748 [Benniella sp.]|nr:MAG: hypothetical protein J3Q66DRAFT_326748 [Benniella sp.]
MIKNYNSPRHCPVRASYLRSSLPSHSNMSFLDQIFGTDGRGHKDEGVWIWLKNQRNKHKNKTKGDGPVSNTRSPTTTASTRSRSDSLNSSLSDLTISPYMSSPCSPISSTSSSDRNPYGPHSPTKSFRTTTSSSPSPPSSPSSPSSPYPYSRQKAMSTFALPTQEPVGNRQMYQNPHQNRSFVDGPIKRSTSSRSTSSLTSSSSVWTSTTCNNSIPNETFCAPRRASNGKTVVQQAFSGHPTQYTQRWEGCPEHGSSAQNHTERVRIEKPAKKDEWWWESQ